MINITACDITYNIMYDSTKSILHTTYNVCYYIRTKERYPDHIGRFVNASDVITADGFSRSVIVINEQFPGPTLEVMEGVQVGYVCVVTDHE